MRNTETGVGTSMLIVAMVVYVAARYWRGSKIGKSDLAITALVSLLLGAQCHGLVTGAQMLGGWIMAAWTWLAGLISG
jgi:hypothetical protein